MRFALALLVAGCTVNGGPIDCPSKQRAPARSGVDAVLVATTNQIYVGGSDYWRWSFGACGGWSKLLPSSKPPPGQYVPVLDDKRDRIVYIGSEVWALDTDKLTFNKLVAVGNPPYTPEIAAAAYDGEHDRIIVGGVGTFALDFSSSDQGLWTNIDTQALMLPSSSVRDPTRSMLLVRDGIGMHAFAMLTGTWHDVTMSGDVPPAGAQLVWGDGLVAVGDHVATAVLDAAATTATFTNLPTTNDPPPRTGASVAISGQYLWLFGGATASGCVLDDVWQLDLTTNAWQMVWPATTC